MSLTGELFHQLEQHPEKTVLFGDEREGWTYRELFQRAGAVAGNVNKSSSPRFGLLIEHGPLFGTAFFGVLLGGGVPVPLNYYLGPDTLSYICKEANVSDVLGDGSFPDKEKQIAPPVHSLKGCLRDVEADGALSSISSQFSLKRSEEHLQELATILFTSGTTSKPKGVKLTKQNVLSNIKGCRTAMDLTEKDHFLTSLPLFHSFGLTGGLLLPLLSGIPTTIHSQFAPKKVLRDMREQRGTIYLAVPSQHRALSRVVQKSNDMVPLHDLHDAIRFISGGGPLPEPLRETFNETLNQPVLEGYGLTETSPVVSVNRLDSRKAGTAGQPLENVRVRVADPDQPERSLETNERGELQIKGPSVMDGYLNQDRISESPFTEDGWLCTGDTGKLDEDGFIQITGRLKELIISAGENISPLHIEECLLKHQTVEEAAVIGVPDERKGEVPLAFVSKKEDKKIKVNTLRERIRQELGTLHEPDEIHLMDELPHGPTGKVLKRQLKEQAGH